LRGGNWLPPTSNICRFQGFAGGLALKPLISNFCRSRAPMAPVHAERASRSLVGSRTLRGSGFFEPRARAIRGSSLLGKGPGHLMPTVAATVLQCGRAFSGAAAARVVGDVGRRTRWPAAALRLPRRNDSGARAPGYPGRGGSRPSMAGLFACS
jgi:hypothetical protein